MATITKMGTADWPLQAVPATSEFCTGTCGQDSSSSSPGVSILPLALQDTEITEGDIEVLLRVARDKNAPAGRYKRVPKKVPTAEPAVAAQM